MNILEVAYGLPGSGKTHLLQERYESLLAKGKDVVLLEYDTPETRKGLIPYLKDFTFEHSYILIDAMIEPLKFLKLLHERDMGDINVIINRFKPDIEQSIKNDIKRGRELNAFGAIKHMKIYELNEMELVRRFYNINQILIAEHNTYGVTDG